MLLEEIMEKILLISLILVVVGISIIIIYCLIQVIWTIAIIIYGFWKDGV